MPVPANITELSATPGGNYPLGTESPSSLDDYLRAHAAFIAQNYADRTPVGVVQYFAGVSAPTGWLACTGQLVSRATYAALFAAIGTTWGAGDGTTTFRLPPADRTLMGAGGLYAVGAIGGSKDAVAVAHTHTASTGGQSSTHTHTGSTDAQGLHTHEALGNNTNGRFTANGAAGGEFTATQTTSGAGNHSHNVSTNGASNDHTHAVTVNSAGVSGTDANLPPYAAMLLIIKT